LKGVPVELVILAFAEVRIRTVIIKLIYLP
jgi:hypothetical protein